MIPRYVPVLLVLILVAATGLFRVKYAVVSAESEIVRIEREIEAERWRPLTLATEELLRAQGGKLSGVAIGHFAYPESAIGEWVAITQRRFGDLDEVADVRELGSGFLSRKRVLVINADHPTVHTLVALAQREPEMAAYVLSKLFYLGHRLDPTVDGELARLAMDARDRRVG